MYVRDFRASILASKYYKINTKTSKMLVILLILFFSVFWTLGLFTLRGYATKFSSLGTSVLFSFINIEINNQMNKKNIRSHT